MDLHGPALGALAASGRYPGFTAIMTAFGERGYDLDLDKIFELGLRTMLDGMAILLPEHRADPTVSGARRL